MKLYCSKNTPESEIYEYSLLPPEVQNNVVASATTPAIDVNEVKVSQDVVEKALVKSMDSEPVLPTIPEAPVAETVPAAAPVPPVEAVAAAPVAPVAPSRTVVVVVPVASVTVMVCVPSPLS